ncbi:MAG: NAD(P)-binding domain-containing protein [Nitrospinae bacterium]|nr:NAD(P)-binding domain-containing protein [Nitrospinota bacterium]
MTNKQQHILATVPIDSIAHEELGQLYPIVTAKDDARQTLLSLMPDTICLISRGMAPINGEIMDAGRSLLVITRTGAGYENIDIAAATKRGIPVVYAPLLGDAVAEATFAMILALTKRLFYWHESLITGKWDRRVRERTDDLAGKTIGIIGLGKIGREVAKRGIAFGMNIVASDPYVAQEVAKEVSAELKTVDDLLACSDVVSLHAVSTAETSGLINRSNIFKIKKGAYLVNFARGALIENLDILYDALRDGRLAGVGLDVFPDEPPKDFKHPLFTHPNFIGSPHVLASTAGAEARCYRSMCKDVISVLHGYRPKWCVNPEVFELSNLRRR